MLRSVISSIQRRLELRRYDDFTIAEYFRRQGARIGDDCRIMIRDFGSEPFLINIGNHVTIAPEALFATHDGGAWVFTREMPNLQCFGKIEILDNCFIGMRSIILPGVRVGPNSVVGAGAIVTKDVPPNTVVAGCPAVPLCTLDEYRAKLLKSWEIQKPNGYLDDLKPGAHYPAIHIHQRKKESMSLLRDHLKHTLT